MEGEVKLGTFQREERKALGVSAQKWKDAQTKEGLILTREVLVVKLGCRNQG